MNTDLIDRKALLRAIHAIPQYLSSYDSNLFDIIIETVNLIPVAKERNGMSEKEMNQLQSDVKKSADTLRMTVESLEGYDSTAHFTEDLERIYWELSGFMYGLMAQSGNKRND